MTEEAAIQQSPSERPIRSILDRDLQQLRKGLETNPEAAVERYGFALFHCLPLDEQMLYREKIGIACRCEEDHYNLGLAYASREDYDKAIACWNDALKVNPEFDEARFNIAVAYEKTGKIAEAKASYQQYADAIDCPEEAEKVRQHIAELQA
jgi:tetratricopeptide (TPR) repeat protein